MGVSIWQILIVLVLAVLLFGRGRISDLMGDVAKGIRSFRKGLTEDDEQPMKTISPEEEAAKKDEAPQN
jgi:sec-independent protein translocase protein TatA